MGTNPGATNGRTRRAVGAAAVLASALVMAVVPTSPAAAADPVAGGFADARGIIVDLSLLAGAITLPGPLTSTPLNPNTFATASQSCPPQAPAPAQDVFLNVPASPAATSDTVSAMAGANCAATGGPSAVASAQTEGLKALFTTPVPLISADLIRAQANSDCVKAPNAAGSVFVGLVVNGQAIGGSPAPNTIITIPGVARVILNEQHPTADGRGIVVNGIHVIGLSPLLRGDLIISHAVSGVVCPNGKGSEIATGLTKPDITFDKDVTPSTAKGGDTVTYTATVNNTSTAPCDVISFYDHLSSAFTLVSTDGAFGKIFQTPPPVRGDGGQDVILRPTGLVIGAGKSVVQTFVVTLKPDVKPGTYYNNLEIFCAANGDFASGPLAPVTVPAPVAVTPPLAPPPVVPELVPTLPRTGGEPLLALGALVVVGAAVGLRRFATR